MHHVQNMMEEKQYFLEYFLLITLWIYQYFFLKASFYFANFAENKLGIHATRNFCMVSPLHLYTYAYISIENIIGMRNIWPLFLH